MIDLVIYLSLYRHILCHRNKYFEVINILARDFVCEVPYRSHNKPPTPTAEETSHLQFDSGIFDIYLACEERGSYRGTDVVAEHLADVAYDETSFTHTCNTQSYNVQRHSSLRPTLCISYARQDIQRTLN